MVLTSAGPVLPWGQEQQAGGEPSKAGGSDEARGVEPSDVGLAPGDRIEVKWSLTDDNGDTQVQWWGAQVLDMQKDSADGVESLVGRIRYDAMGDFEEVVALVLFLDDSNLYDKGCNSHEAGYLRWRREGSTWDAPDDSGSEEDSEHNVVTMSELQEEVCDDPCAQAAEDEAMHQLSMLPRDRQQYIADGFRNMIDCVKEGLQRIAADGGEAKTITASDIKQIFSRLQGRKDDS